MFWGQSSEDNPTGGHIHHLRTQGSCPPLTSRLCSLERELCQGMHHPPVLSDPSSPREEDPVLAGAAHGAWLSRACSNALHDTARLHLTKAPASNGGGGGTHELPPYPRHRLNPQPRNTSTSWNSEPSSQLSAFRAHARLAWSEETVLPRALQAQPRCSG